MLLRRDLFDVVVSNHVPAHPSAAIPGLNAHSWQKKRIWSCFRTPSFLKRLKFTYVTSLRPSGSHLRRVGILGGLSLPIFHNKQNLLRMQEQGCILIHI